jgi:hypothetical protein
MFCPLCRSEFRDGFTECSDCHVALVPTSEEASASSVRLWKGDRQKELDRILAALDDAKIPAHYKEIVNSISRFEIFGIPIGPQRSTFEYEIWIFRRDLERARSSACLA